MSLEDITKNTLKASIVAGSAYMTANSPLIASLGYFMLGAYAISYEPLQNHLENKLDSHLEDCIEEKKEEARRIIKNAKSGVAKIGSAFQMMAAVYGLIDTHKAMVHDDPLKFIASAAITAGYCGICLKSIKYAERLKAKE